MASATQSTLDTGRMATREAVPHFDAIVIGAGVSGLYQLYRLREAGLKARIYEDGDGVGGTWFWNRYPGCRFDSESETYGYSFSKELLQEWDWKEHYSGQPENERYLNYVADKFNLRPDIQLSSRVTKVVWDEDAKEWDVEINGKDHARARFVVAAVGILSARFTPPFEGAGSFKGLTLHTGTWPKEPVDLKGKKVAVIGTGPTGVQLITEIAKEVGHLTVFQRTPNYCAPLRNGLVRDDVQRDWKANYDEMHKRIRNTAAGFTWDFDSRSAFSVSPEERLRVYEELWARPGFAKWLGNFYDIMTDRAANEDFAEFVRNKIRARVKDPVVAEMLVPKDHPFGAKRVPLESGYFETFNRDNVKLIDLRATPIERITPNGIKTTDKEFDFDVIIYATGFDAVSGALTSMDIRGEGGLSFKEKWADGARTNLGITTAGFPNFFMAMSIAFCNYPVCAEMVAEWIADCIAYMRDKGLKKIQTTPAAEEAWHQHAQELAGMTLLSGTKSWFMGTNIPGKKAQLLLYANSAPNYRKECREVAESGYKGYVLS